MESDAFVNNLRSETARIKRLTEECRRMGISLERLPKELGHIRTLLHDRKMDEALDYIREIKLDLLARLLLQGPDVIPPSEIENPPPAGPLPDSVLSAIDNQVAPSISPSKRTKPPA